MAEIFTAALSAQSASQERHARKAATHDADVAAQQLEADALQAEQDAELAATEKARKRQASQTQTINTSPLGDTETAATKKPTLLGTV